MSEFNLSNGTNIYTLDLAGKVFDETNNQVGKWTTNNQNKIVINKNSGDNEEIAVCWQFDTNHQFCLLDSHQNLVYNFHSTPSNRPKCTLADAVLVVTPINRRVFQFQVRGDWSIDEQHRLIFVCDGITSTLDGILSDNKSRFIYRATDKVNNRITHRLRFAGRWEQLTDSAGVPQLKFHYRKEADQFGVFDLPANGNFIIQKGSNQFQYVYDKDNRKFGLTLVGFLEINENLEISYTIDRQSSNGKELVSQTTLALQTAFSGEDFEGNLGLVLLKGDNSPGSHELTITGDYTGVIGATRVMIGFRYTQRKNNNLLPPREFGIGGAFAWNNGAVTYAFDVGAKFIALELGTQIKLRNGGAVDAKTSIIGSDGQVRTITFLLGITF